MCRMQEDAKGRIAAGAAILTSVVIVFLTLELAGAAGAGRHAARVGLSTVVPLLLLLPIAGSCRARGSGLAFPARLSTLCAFGTWISVLVQVRFP